MTDKFSEPDERQAEIETALAWIRPLRTEIAKVIVGQTYLIDRLLVGLDSPPPHRNCKGDRWANLFD